eukprot:Gregarina_sp_Pseudo_9__4985@NODE_522_length_2651_cov_11_575421_g493_i0_p2_GENE_NODE_522_length_2651_cov_11_575421_g493_i0NODE_522_length_2651_cov_11_575421_g493_i0_p2_ORF_typecomplete_len259_score21_99Methyltransf_16/PF10294_9/1_1e17Methyltransf_31/PF13847_6/1_9e05Methyltransf_23/PF13489_6/0_0032MTS/PF05175_14/0_0096_NODE_522_length_2651_cov_11_575421_g493_i014062182
MSFLLRPSGCFASAAQPLARHEDEHATPSSGRDSHAAPRLVQKDVYEGGSDVWECSHDLCSFLSGNLLRDLILTPSNLRVLEIGAGHGLPSLTLCKLRAEAGLRTCVTLQDLNQDSLLQHALPLFRAAFQDPKLTQVTFVPCSWEAMLEQPCKSGLELSSNSADTTQHLWEFDLVLSSETLYRKENFSIIADLLASVFTANPKAKALFAQKRFYFGLGGGALPFQLYVKECTELAAQVVYSIESGHSNVRDILLIEGP